jgi:N-acylneuraminate cytidylyltransferase/CMP-N,N'-diacetyllegionaminic acid synthase
MRPKALATDSSKVIDVILHALDWLSEEKRKYDLVMLLQPTSPLRSTKDIDKTIELLFARKASAIVSVCKCEHSPFLMNVLPADGSMKDFLKNKMLNKNRQELPIFYRLNGAVYLAYCGYLRRNNGFFGRKTYSYIMPSENSIDIDSQLDFDFAEFVKKFKK